MALSPPPSPGRAERLVLAFLALACLVATAWRLPYGVDLGDEALNVAIPYRFALGDRPYVDEINPTQSAALFSYPFVKLYVEARGGTEGLVLFLRAVWLVLTVGLAFAIFASLRARFGVAQALLAGLLAVVWLPLGSATLSYNTFASGLYVLGVFLGVRPFLDGSKDRWFAFAGISHGAAAVAIQSYALSGAAFVLMVVLALVPRLKRARAAGLYLLGALVVPALLSPLLLQITSRTIEFARNHLVQRHASLAERAGVLAGTVVDHLPRPGWMAAAAVLFLAACRWRLGWAALAALASMPLLGWQMLAHQSSLLHVTWTCLFCPVLFWPLRRDAAARVLFFGVWAPSACAAIAAAVTSSNGVVAAGMGFFPGVIATALLAARNVRDIATWSPSCRGATWLAAAWPALLIATMVVDQRHPKNDDPIGELSARIEDGPFAGLVTTPEKRAWIENLGRDLQTIARPGARVSFVTICPAGYLMSTMRPASRSLWPVHCWPEQDWDCVDTLGEDLEHYGANGVVVVRVQGLFHGRQRYVRQPPGKIGPFLDRHLERVLERLDWTIFASRGAFALQ
ncbi:MAG: hypothetical protein ACKVXR_02510 [Planctomycetota bacterium]